MLFRGITSESKKRVFLGPWDCCQSPSETSLHCAYGGPQWLIRGLCLALLCTGLPVRVLMGGVEGVQTGGICDHTCLGLSMAAEELRE